jgi:predicted RNA-binding protein (TIGR00451 family)
MSNNCIFPHREGLVELDRVSALLDYAYGPPTGSILKNLGVKFVYSPRSQRLRDIYADGLLYAVMREDGYPLLQRYGLKLLEGSFLTKSVTVKAEAVQCVRAGGNVFCRHIAGFNGRFAIDEDCVVVSPDDRPIACGRLLIHQDEIRFFKKGVAVKTRFGVADPADEIEQ